MSSIEDDMSPLEHMYDDEQRRAHARPDDGTTLAMQPRFGGRMRHISIVLATFATLALVACGGSVDATHGTRPGDRNGAHSSTHANAGGDHYLGALSNGAPVCSSGLASDAFAFGLCICGDASFAGDLHVHGQDASTPASAAANGAWARAGSSEIDGDLVVGSEMSGAGDDHVFGNLDVGADFSQAGVVDVGGDAHIAGNALAAGDVTIAGTLTVPDDAQVFGVQSAGVVRADVNVPLPCDCSDTASTHIDVAGLVAQARTTNDDAAAGIDPNGFVDAGDVDLTLGAGNFFVEQIAHAGSIHVHATGATALFVANDIASAGDITVDVDDGATFDLFVGGDIASAGLLHLGTAERADAVRVYIDGAGGLAIAGDETFAGALYMPHGTLASAGDLDVAGAVVAADLAAAGTIDIGFASGLATGGSQTCTPPSAGDTSDTGANGGDGSSSGDNGGAEIPSSG